MKTYHNTLKLLVTTSFVLVLGATGGLPGEARADDTYRPEKAKRSLNTDQYTLSIQKDDRIDIHTLDGLPIMRNMFAEVTLLDKSPRPIRLDYQQSERVVVNNDLGQGNGLHFKSAEGEWLIATYPGQPFITVDLTYINATKKTVYVTALSPWTSGEEGSGGVFVGPSGSGEIRILQNSDPAGKTVQIVDSSEPSTEHVAARNLATGDTLIAGFTTHGAGHRTIQLTRNDASKDKNSYRLLSLCEFFEPIALEPGATLRLDTLYIAIREHAVQAGLGRFVAASSRVDPYPVLPAKFRHGWLANPNTTWDERALQQVMDSLAGDSVRLGWSHVLLGTSWWTPSSTGLVLDTERFPNGLSALCAYAHERGLTLGLTVPVQWTEMSAVAQFVSACEVWGVDSVELAYGVAAKASANTRAHHPRAIYDALETLSYSGRRPVYVRPTLSAPTGLSDWAQSSRAYYLPPSGNPLLTRPMGNLLQDTTGLSDPEFVTAFTLAAIQGLNLRPTTPFAALSPLRQQVMSRLLPVGNRGGIPLDLFQDGPPHSWYLPLKTEAGSWTILGMFNWDERETVVRKTPLAAFGLNPGVRYTVYDFWAGAYLGNIMDELKLEIPAGGVRLLGLRYAEQRPMLVASNRNISQGAHDHEAITWSHGAQRLSGRFKGTPGFPYRLTFYIPEPYRLQSVTCLEPFSREDESEQVIHVSLTPGSEGLVDWALQF